MANKTALELIKSGLSKILDVRSSKAVPIDLSVDSSAIDAVGYDPKSSILRITFQSGSSYSFFGVDLETFNEFLDSNSLGRYFVENIRNDYIYFKIG